jgi:hypothetical protein
MSFFFLYFAKHQNQTTVVTFSVFALATHFWTLLFGGFLVCAFAICKTAFFGPPKTHLRAKTRRGHRGGHLRFFQPSVVILKKIRDRRYTW